MRAKEVGEKITVSKSSVPNTLPSRFYESALSIKLGAKAVYREDKKEYSVQIREYSDKYVLQLDRHNPKYNAVGHAVVDAPGYTIAALATGAALTTLSSS